MWTRQYIDGWPKFVSWLPLQGLWNSSALSTKSELSYLSVFCVCLFLRAHGLPCLQFKDDGVSAKLPTTCGNNVGLDTATELCFGVGTHRQHPD